MEFTSGMKRCLNNGADLWADKKKKPLIYNQIIFDKEAKNTQMGER